MCPFSTNEEGPVQASLESVTSQNHPTVVPGRLERLPTTYRFPGQESDADRRHMVDCSQDVGILVVAEFVA
jgi:hypothetical protein